MDHVLTEYGLRLSYVRNPKAYEELDQDRILDDLSDDTSDVDPLPWFGRHGLTGYDHVVVVTDRSSGRYRAFLAANDRATQREEFLCLETTFVAAAARGQNLTRRMIAFAMLRVGGLAQMPTIIAACTRNPQYYRIMRGLAHRITGTTFFPNPESNTIDFHAATLAQRIARALGANHRLQATSGTVRGRMTATGYSAPISYDPEIDLLFSRQMRPADRMLSVLDFRGGDEATILDDARRIYRSR
jgi:hypothetical protein